MKLLCARNPLDEYLIEEHWYPNNKNFAVVKDPVTREILLTYDLTSPWGLPFKELEGKAV